MVRTLFDSTIEIWAANYINNPEVMALEDRDKEIQQIEAIPGSQDFIVEVFRPAREEGERSEE